MLLTEFEPEINFLRGTRTGQSRFISGKLAKSPDDSFIEFPSNYGRHTTLAGIWMFLEKDHRQEYLVTAFGKQKGQGLCRPAQFYGLHISYGAERSVQFSPYWFDYLQKHIERISNAEVLICHNHPKHVIRDIFSQLLDWSPLPSNKDRETLFRFKYEAIVRWYTSGNFQNLRFFLVEEGRLREFQLPPINRLIEIAQTVASFL
ncbi:MAG TPA: hypothetical protein ACFYD4_12640 [Candidatus Wunengus sp. YC61]|uniref:hypothetical protein n=1 Tax=Candidatus Wunengus sp. YC61 TaxID=3367698 RepID=UPI004024FBA4